MSALDREEYIEQAYFFRTFGERLAENLPSQEILDGIREEILATTKLPMALDVLRGELMHSGRISTGMTHLKHYFTPFQAFVMQISEEDKTKFDQRVALHILEREAKYRSESVTPAGLFIYQFECVARNRLGYHYGLEAIAHDPFYDELWRDWIMKVRLRLGENDFADLIYFRSEWYVEEKRRDGRPDYQPTAPLLFSRQEGRIAKANRGKDPLYLFAALQRQLGYPSVPRVTSAEARHTLHPVLEARLQRLEKRLQLVEGETKGQVDLSEFYANPPVFTDEDDTSERT
ncbi:MAG TPA: hypothetical protein VM165_18040 [Planctomycetaceae bacterium]|nr:hypothetical protein [Planctomycetaceae bacterium]